MKHHPIIVLIALTSLSDFASADQSPIQQTLKQHTEIRYSREFKGLYLSLNIYHKGKHVITLHGDIESGGAFKREEPPRTSPNNHYIYISQVEAAEVETPNGPKTSERTYCSLVDVRNGCIIARETGSFCGGTFTKDGKWENSLYPNLDLVTTAPKISAYSDGRLMPTGSPEASIENLIACDPPNDTNMKDYKSSLKKNIFNLSIKQRNELLKNLKERHEATTTGDLTNKSS